MPAAAMAFPAFVSNFPGFLGRCPDSGDVAARFLRWNCRRNQRGSFCRSGAVPGGRQGSEIPSLVWSRQPRRHQQRPCRLRPDFLHRFPVLLHSLRRNGVGQSPEGRLDDPVSGQNFAHPGELEPGIVKRSFLRNPRGQRHAIDFEGVGGVARIRQRKGRAPGC